MATVTINIGLEKNNPTLVIRPKDNLSELVDKLIKDYKLPKNVYAIIMEGVQQQLKKYDMSKPVKKDKI